jgi:hypothetical protein
VREIWAGGPQSEDLRPLDSGLDVAVEEVRESIAQPNGFGITELSVSPVHHRRTA